MSAAAPLEEKQSAAASAAAPKKKSKQPRRRNMPEVFDPIMQDVVDRKDLIIIGASRRVKFVINPDEFMNAVRTAIVGKKVELMPNVNITKYGRLSDVSLTSMMAKTGNYTMHMCKYSFMVKVTKITGKSAKEIHVNHLVDVFGVRRSKNSPPLYTEDIELYAWMDRQVLLADKTHVACVKGTCPGVFDKQILVADQAVTCPECKTTQCASCECEWHAHEGKTCAAFRVAQRADALSDPAMLKEMFVDGTGQPCPGCAVFISKIEGCNKMICDHCHAYWCWACRCCDLRRLYENPYHHYYADNMVDHRGVPVNHGIDGNQRRCPAGGEFTPDVRQFVVETNRRLFADKYAAFPVIWAKFVEDENKERAAKGLPLMENDVERKVDQPVNAAPLIAAAPVAPGAPARQAPVLRMAAPLGGLEPRRLNFDDDEDQFGFDDEARVENAILQQLVPVVQVEEDDEALAARLQAEEWE